MTRVKKAKVAKVKARNALVPNQLEKINLNFLQEIQAKVHQALVLLQVKKVPKDLNLRKKIQKNKIKKQTHPNKLTTQITITRVKYNQLPQFQNH